MQEYCLTVFLKTGIFLIRKIPTKREMIEQLRRGKVSLPPLSFRLLEGLSKAGGNRRLDAYAEASWRKNAARFAIECKSLSTPKAFRDGLNLLKSTILPKGYLPFSYHLFLGVP